MRIISFKTDNFAGLKDLDLDFDPGMNILLGPNESGKSTVIDALYYTLFKPSKLHKTRDKGFISKFFNESLDEIDGDLTFESEGQVYTIKRVWSRDKKGGRDELTLPSGDRLTSPKKIKDKLDEIFPFGPASYKYLNFPSHRDLRDSLSNLATSEELKGDVRGYLNRSVMELDGLSLEDLEDRIIAKMKDLGSRWDFSRSMPQNNRGIDNPYVNGVGRILEAYYDKETLARKLRQAKKREEAFEEAAQDLKEIKENLDKLSKDKDYLDGLFEDIRKRSGLERDLKDIERDTQALIQAIQKFPALENDLANEKKDLARVKAEETEVKARLDYIEKRKERLRVEKKLKGLKDLARDLDKLAKDLEGLKDIKVHYLDDLNKLRDQIELNKARLKAGEIQARLDIFDEDLDLTLEDGLGQPVAEKGEGSYFKLSKEGGFSFEVSLKGLDPDKIKESIKMKRKFIEKTLADLGQSSLSDLEEAIKKKKSLEEEEKILKLKFTSLAQGETIEALEASYQDLKDYDKDYSEEDLVKSLEDLSNDRLALEKAFYANSQAYQSLKEDFTSLDQALKSLTNKVEAKAGLKLELSRLKDLPEEFKSSEDFFKDKTQLDSRYKKTFSAYSQAKDRYKQTENDLLDETAEDLQGALKEKEENFTYLLKLYEDLDAIKKTFYETKEEMVASPNYKLEEAMDKYLSRLTNESIKLKSLEDKISLEDFTGKSLGYIHLSKGSKEAVALALRLALVDSIFEGESFIAFDDIFTDLDDERTREAVKLLKTFCQGKQIIFASYREDLSRDLSGNTIKLRPKLDSYKEE